jgi:hypothetical protein
MTRKLYNKEQMLRDDTSALENAKDIRAYHLNQWFDRVYENPCKILLFFSNPS